MPSNQEFLRVSGGIFLRSARQSGKGPLVRDRCKGLAVKSFQDRKTLYPPEYVTKTFPPQEIPEDLGERLWRDYGSQVAVEFPSPKTHHQWELTAQGWVGYIPLAPELGFSLQPKVSLGNLFRMLEYAYRLKSFEFLDDLVGCQSLEGFYERLVNVLARRVLDRARKGFYRAYLPEFELFVAEWLKAHLPGGLLLGVQEHVDVGEENAMRFNIDLVLTDAKTGETCCVLDTKYKAKRRPDQGDVSQVIAYAEIKDCDQAVLIYPETLSEPLDEWFGNIRVRSMTFSLAGDLEQAGRSFLRELSQQIGRGVRGGTLPLRSQIDER